jgi:hypothetical protein
MQVFFIALLAFVIAVSAQTVSKSVRMMSAGHPLNFVGLHAFLFWNIGA